jgi:hypothetical protein
MYFICGADECGLYGDRAAICFAVRDSDLALPARAAPRLVFDALVFDALRVRVRRDRFLKGEVNYL